MRRFAEAGEPLPAYHLAELAHEIFTRRLCSWHMREERGTGIITTRAPMLASVAIPLVSDGRFRLVVTKRSVVLGAEGGGGLGFVSRHGGAEVWNKPPTDDLGCEVPLFLSSIFVVALE